MDKANSIAIKCHDSHAARGFKPPGTQDLDCLRLLYGVARIGRLD